MKKRLAASALIILGLFSAVFGQNKGNETSADRTLRGSGRVNASTLGMEFDLPLGGYPGRGISVPINLSYSSKQWRMQYSGISPVPGTGGRPCFSHYNPTFAEESASGWTTSIATPYIEYIGAKNFYNNDGNGVTLQNESYCTGYSDPYPDYYVRRIMVRLPSGESHEMIAEGGPISFTSNGTGDPNGPYNAYMWDTTFYAVDGSNIKYVQDSLTNTYRLLMTDGSFYDFDPTTVHSSDRKAVKFTDRNGNNTNYYPPGSVDNNGITHPNGYWKDTLGRNIPIPFQPQPQTATTAGNPQIYSMPGIGGATVNYKLHWKLLKGSSAAESGLTNFSDSLAYYGDTYSCTSQSGFPTYCSRTTEPVLFSGGNSIIVSDELFNPVVLTEIELPNGQSYKFTYDIYGRIEKIKYPIGGEEVFHYDAVVTLSMLEPGDVGGQTNFGVTNRKVYKNENDPSPYEWTYSANYVTTLAGYQVNINNPDGTQTQRFLHRGNGINGNSPFGFDNSLAGMSYEERAFDGSNPRKLVSKKLTNWVKTVYPRVTEDESIVFDNAGNGVSTTTKIEYEEESTLAWGKPLLQKKSSQYGFVTVGSALPSAPVRSSESTFLINDISVGNRQDYKDRNMVGLVTATVVKDGAGTPVSQNQIKYDENVLPNNYVRGNPTTVKSWLNTDNSWIEAKSKYDDYGNMIETTDPKGHVSYIQYADNYADGINRNTYAFPTKTISAIPGGNGSTSAFEATIKYDFQTGLPTAATDANGQTSSIEYNDPLLRPTKSIAPNGHQTITEYGAGTTEATRFIKVKTQIDDTKWKEGYSWYDGLGRTIKTQSVDTNGDVFGLTCYDQYGRVSKTSNPFRNVTNPTCSSALEWTTNVYDEAGRVKEIVTPDGAKVQTAYGVATVGNQIGTTVTVKDQALKERRSITNALGQLTRVDEPTINGLGAINSPNQPTYYEYDTLSNLTKVKQGGTETAPEQTRSFAYDSLSRLKTATNPELGTTATNGTIYYIYDNNGNLTQKNDPRGVQTNYVYDALNRVTYRSYQNEPAGQPPTPTVAYFYDGIYYDAQDQLQTASGAIKGKLTSVSSSVSRTNYEAFDTMGRVTQSRQLTENTDNRPMEYIYNLSGALIEQKYPSGRVVKTTLDADGMLAQVQSKKANDTFRNYANSFNYTAAGAVSSMRLGNGKWENTVFNSRLQPIQIGLGNSATDQGLMKLNFDYGTTANNGNVQSQTITVPTTGQTAGFTAVQTYNYDELNRLKAADEKPLGYTQAQCDQNPASCWKQTFTFDRYGNRRFDETNTTTIDANCATAVCNPTIDPNTNKLIGYTFDAAGNTTFDAQSKTFTYDAENKQTKVKNSNNITVGEYFYDGDGKRVKKVVPATGETTVFIYDASGKMVAEYSTVTNNNPQVSYLTTDHLGSPRINTDANGAVTARHDYQPFGEEIARASYGADDVRKQFTGYEKDEETDLDFAQARYFNSGVGRFSSPDNFLNDTLPIDPASWNLYVYVRNNPLIYIDPTGMEYVNNNCEKGKNNCETVKYKRVKGKIVYVGGKGSGEETEDLKKLVAAINASGSKKAIDRFFSLNKSETQVTIKIGNGILIGKDSKKQNSSGETFAHDKDGNTLDMNTADRNDAAFLDNGEYEAVTISFMEDLLYLQSSLDDERKTETTWSKSDELAAVFGHESVHVTDKASRNAIRNKESDETIATIFHPDPINKNRDPFGRFTFPANSPVGVANAIRLEIYENRKKLR